MRNMRSHEIDAASMFEFHIAADARMSRLNYLDDQAWKLDLGGEKRAALAFQTQYGSRADLVSIVPRWQAGGRQVYQYQAYHQPPVLRHFAPNFLEIEAEIRPGLALRARYWAMESSAAGCEFSITNHSEADVELQLELFGQVVINGRQQKLNVLTMGDYSLALHLGQIGNIHPVLALEGASHDIYGGRISSPKLGRGLRLPAGATIRAPFVVAGLTDMRESHSVAMNWLARPWHVYFEKIDGLALVVPQIHSGDNNCDLLLDLSYNLLLQARMEPTVNLSHLSHSSLVANRAINRGWSRRGDGRDHIRTWAGQDPTLVYLAASAAAGIVPDWSKALIRNYLSTQDDSGFIDRQPGLAGQTEGILMMPLLARLAWNVFQLNHDLNDDQNEDLNEDLNNSLREDREFLGEVFLPLTAFFERWLQEDQDGDGLPEWQSERQMAYVAFPSFGASQGWAQGANVRQMETPDLLAYLISEADALAAIARELEDEAAENKFRNKLKDLQEHLEEFWQGSRYAYRDRDTHHSGKAIELLRGGAGDERHIIKRSLLAPNRVLVRVVGGVSQVPRLQLRLIGKDLKGENCVIEADVGEFDWHNRQGIYITHQALSYVDTIKIEGLSRVYKVYAKTIDSSRLDINHLLPLWTGLLAQERAAALVALAMDETHFYCPNGITMVSRRDANYDASNARGGGGIWMYFLSLIGEGMVKSGFQQEATSLVKRVLSSLSQVLAREGGLSQFYHAEAIQGFGEVNHIGGILPLKLLADVLGIHILSPLKVRVGGPFTWGQEVKIAQHGVIVTRNAEKIEIDFPSGYSLSLAAQLEWQVLTDTTAIQEEVVAAQLPAPPDINLFSESADERAVIDIKVDIEVDIETEIEAEDEVDAARSAGATPDPKGDYADASGGEDHNPLA